MDQKKLDHAIAICKTHVPTEGFYGGFSGGKDSVALHEVARLSGVPVAWHYHTTTIDPPEVVRFVKDKYPQVHFEKPKYGNFFHRMETRGGAMSQAAYHNWDLGNCQVISWREGRAE